MAGQMQMMDSLNARLDTLVSRMNRSSGNQKVTAMAEVINELVAQRKLMQEHMRQMMQPPGEDAHDGRARAHGASRAAAEDGTPRPPIPRGTRVTIRQADRRAGPGGGRPGSTRSPSSRSRGAPPACSLAP